MINSTALVVLSELLGVALVGAVVAAAYFRRRAEHEQNLRVEAALVARALTAVRDSRTFSGGLAAAAGVLCSELGSSILLIAVEEDAAPRQVAQRWLFRYEAGKRTPEIHDLLPSQREAYFFPFPDGAAAFDQRVNIRGNARTWSGDGHRVTPTEAPFQPSPETVLAVGTNDVAACETRIDPAWRIRWFLQAPAAYAPASGIRLLIRACEELTPALHNIYLIRRVRKHAITEERARIGRELHDTVVQSLIGLEMGVAAMAASTASLTDVAECATYVRDTLRDEIANVRDLMHSFRPLDVSGDTLPRHLSDLADRFERDTGIRTTFVCGTSTARLPRRWCVDVARIAQEALVNVRKHSGATAVTMRLVGDEKGVTLRINDNGRGFTFTGRLDDEALWHQRKGPLVIKERARAIGASVAVESTPGRGASVEMSLSYAC